MKHPKIVLIVALTNGKIVYDYFKRNRFADLKLTITYPDNTNKPRCVNFEEKKDKSTKIIKSINESDYIKEIEKIEPDFIFVAGWSYILSEKLIKIPKKGTIGFHPSKLPLDRGRSTLAWQIREGYTETALTMFYYNNIPDGGDIIGQEKITIESNDYIIDILNKIDDVTFNLIKSYFPLLKIDKAPRKKQNLSNGSVRRLLNSDDDTMLDWNKNTKELYDKVRATSKPYPGASCIIKNKKYRVWKAEIVETVLIENSLKAGEVFAKLFDGSLIIKCRDKYLRVIDFE